MKVEHVLHLLHILRSNPSFVTPQVFPARLLSYLLAGVNRDPSLRFRVYEHALWLLKSSYDLSSTEADLLDLELRRCANSSDRSLRLLTG